MNQMLKCVKRARAAMLVMVVVSSVTLSLFAAEIYPKRSKHKEKLTAEQILARLDALLAEEERLLQAVAEIKNEVAIVRVRASAPSIDSCP